MKFVFLYTDIVIWLLAILCAFYGLRIRARAALKRKWSVVFSNRTAAAAFGVLTVFFSIALLDSVHYRPLLQGGGSVPVYATRTVSVLDTLVGEHIAGRERSYSAPFALVEFDKTAMVRDGKNVRDFAPLKGIAAIGQGQTHAMAVAQSCLSGTVCGLAFATGLFMLLGLVRAFFCHIPPLQAMRDWVCGKSAGRPVLVVWLVTAFLVGWLLVVWGQWHVLGTDTTGKDVLFCALKSVRTAVVIGTLATFSMLPLAVLLGILAGYLRGWVDDLIQYLYTTISSIPSVLLIAASVLLIQVFIDKNPHLYETGLERADLRLFLLAAIIGVTGWSGLARLLRAETMKIATMDYVVAARAFGLSAGRIMWRHVLPNIVHIVLIVAVLDFSGIVLYEAVLSYVGVGVDPTMESFGSMINSAAAEMSRTPVIWWNLLASFLFMVALVLSANLFASGVRDAFDPSSGKGGSNA